MEILPPLQRRELPQPPGFSKIFGVGIVITGLAMGTGELVLWPHIVTKYGLHLLWLALLGIIFQYFINQEVARLSLATGESFFTSTARLSKWFAPFWALAGLLLYVWPGWASALGTTLRELFGFGTHITWGLIALSIVLVITFIGRVAYQVLENSLKIIVPSFFFLLVFISFFNLSIKDITDAFAGLMSFGQIPPGTDLSTLLSAIVFAGAGGMLNLCVSLWYRDKGFGMGNYAGRIKNPVTGGTEAVSATGYDFEINTENLSRWKKWMRAVYFDQGIIFLLFGFLTLFLLSLNAFVVLSERGLVPEGLNVAVVQAYIFGDVMGPVGFKLFLIMAFLMLFSVMWTVIDALARIISDIIHTHSRVGPWSDKLSWLSQISLSHMYYVVIVIVVLAGGVLLPLEQPLVLLKISAVLGALTMAIYTPILLYYNNRHLPKPLRPGIFTNVALVLGSIFFIYFSVRVIFETVKAFI